MPVRELTATEVVQRCSKCGAENRVQLDAIEAGISRDDQIVDARVVALPACAGCKSSEYLIRSPDDEPAHPSPGSYGHLHRLLVDQVHAELVKRKRVVSALKDKLGRVDASLGRALSADDQQRWFAKGLRLDPLAGEPTDKGTKP